MTFIKCTAQKMRISSVNVTKPAVSCYCRNPQLLKKSLMENFIFCVVMVMTVMKMHFPKKNHSVKLTKSVSKLLKAY